MSKNPGKYWSKNGPNTSAALAQLLDAEGFSDHCANQVEGYWRRSSASKDLDHIQMLREGVAALSKKLTEAEKKILGRFVSLHMRMGFDTGLRMGLAVRFVREPEGSYTPAAQRAAHGPREDLALDTGECDGGVGSVAAPSSVGQAGSASSGAFPSGRQHPSGPPAAGSREARLALRVAITRIIEAEITADYGEDTGYPDTTAIRASGEIMALLAPAPEPRPHGASDA